LALGIDFTARDVQKQAKEKGLPWEKAKAFDHSAPISKFFDKDELGNMANIEFRLRKNDEVVQTGNSGDMIFAVDQLIAYVSQFVTLKIGDLIFTGTPEGVGPVAIGDELVGSIGEKDVLFVPIK
jgi:2-keto-4-pentenoate hydratase/2-oxohepta-3-ene-1,7-dioic acid hydratase in catechol pathway